MIMPGGTYIPSNRHLLGNVGVGGSAHQQGIAPQQAMTTFASRELVPVESQAAAGAMKTLMAQSGTNEHAAKQRLYGVAAEGLQQGPNGAQTLLNSAKSRILPRDGYVAALGNMLAKQYG